MAPNEEESFPRGGKKPKFKAPVKRHYDENLFSLGNGPKAKKTKKSNKLREKIATDDSFYSNLNIQGTLSYNKLQEGMVILSCVRHVTDFSVEVELPGLTFGYVNITRISDTFTKLLNKKLETNDEESDIALKKMFHIGQFVPVKIIGFEEKDKGVHVNCSMNPRDIFEGKSHIWFKKGMLIWACIQSVLDHGYEVNVGVKNCRVFLPSKNVDEGVTLTIGEPFWCIIHRCEVNNAATTLRVSSKIEHVEAAKIEEVANLDTLMPGMEVDFVIDKIVFSGIQGKFLNDYFAYIDYSQLRDPLDELTNYKEGTLVQAYVLFVEPATKVTHLSLRGLDPVPPPSINVGDIIKAEVVLKVNNGIYLKGQADISEKCFITNKRLIASLPRKPNIDMQDAINSKFPVGSKHSVRILDYNHISRFYVSTVEQTLLKEKNFTSSDFEIGQLVSVTIDSIKPEGIVVNAGHIKGFVPNLYLTNAEYTENIKRKFKEGVKLNARVLHIDNSNIIFTLKPGQVESNECLVDLKQVKRGDNYHGVVVYTKETGAMVVFYNNVTGWINSKQLGDRKSGGADPRQYFFKGQVANFWILGIKNEKAILSIRPPSEFNADKGLNLKIGQRVNGVCGTVHRDTIVVKNKRGLTVGVIPKNHLSSGISLCAAFMKTFKEGDPIENLICIDNTTKPCLLSRKESLIINESSRIRVKKFENVKKGNIIKCSYLAKAETGIYVKPLLKDYSQKNLVQTKNILEVGQTLPNFRPQQSLVARVLSINHTSKELELTIKLSKVFNSSVEAIFEQFSHYIKDLMYLRKFGQENNWELCRFQPGERVSCKVEQLGDEGGCLVTLPNGVQGLVPPKLCPDNIKVGQSLQGVFLAENFEENFVEICLKMDILQRINVFQDGVLKTSNVHNVLAEKLLIKNDYILGVLKPDNCNRQLIYIPTHLHENDFSGCTSYYEQNRIKLCICGEVENHLIGISRKLFLYLDKQNGKLKRKTLEKRGNEVKTLEMPSKIKQKQEVKNERKKIVAESKDEIDAAATSEEENERNEEINESGIECGDVDSVDDENDFNTDYSKQSDVSEPTGKAKKDQHNSVLDRSHDLNVQDKEDTSIVSSLPKLSGVSSFFNPVLKEESESSSEDEENVVAVKKKKKLTPKERMEQLRVEEERISKIERELADSSKDPESAEQFDRLLLANPNSSELWTKYMSFHLAATEIGKARTVARRALEAIEMTRIDERLNIWIALLNLENMLGTKESFENTFEDALKFNDSLEIYLKVIQLLGESGKVNEMEEKIKKVRSKHKQETKMWLEVAKTYYMLHRFQDARNMKEASLKSIQNKKTQMELIFRFAIMEFKYGEEDQGAAIFETILSNDPKKVTAWTVYVDQLVKKGQIVQARRVLERAVSMHLPVKSMKSLYLKFRMFEEQHGTPESVDAVKRSAKMYFDKVSKNLD